MRIIKHSKNTSATPNQIWQLWENVQQWKEWDEALEASGIKGPFQEGTKGFLKFKDGTSLPTLLTHVEPLKLFTQEATLFLAKVVMSHAIKQEEGYTRITFEVQVTGLLALFYALFLGRSIRNKVPKEMDALIKKAEG